MSEQLETKVDAIEAALFNLLTALMEDSLGKDANLYTECNEILASLVADMERLKP